MSRPHTTSFTSRRLEPLFLSQSSSSLLKRYRPPLTADSTSEHASLERLTTDVMLSRQSISLLKKKLEELDADLVAAKLQSADLEQRIARSSASQEEFKSDNAFGKQAFAFLQKRQKQERFEHDSYVAVFHEEQEQLDAATVARDASAQLMLDLRSKMRQEENKLYSLRTQFDADRLRLLGQEQHLLEQQRFRIPLVVEMSHLLDECIEWKRALNRQMELEKAEMKKKEGDSDPDKSSSGGKPASAEVDREEKITSPRQQQQQQQHLPPIPSEAGTSPTSHSHSSMLSICFWLRSLTCFWAHFSQEIRQQ